MIPHIVESSHCHYRGGLVDLSAVALNVANHRGNGFRAGILQSLLHQRYKLRRSTLITANRILDDWKSFLGDAALTTAILDRLLHRSVLVEFRGKSYRLKEAASRLAKGPANE